MLIHIRAGDTYDAGEHVFTLREGEGSSAVAVDLTGCAVLWKTKHRVTGTTGSSAATVVAALLGQVSPVYSKTESAALEVGDHVAELQVTYPDTTERTFPTPDQPAITMRVTRGL